MFIKRRFCQEVDLRLSLITHRRRTLSILRYIQIFKPLISQKVHLCLQLQKFEVQFCLPQR